jgi:hypothetical protein|tara:strand:- start:2913 stop:3671 length:759 start_codon:yes stop_codon:yes gene_type:complete
MSRSILKVVPHGTQIIEKLKNDEDYYGEYGQQFLSNSNIYNLLRFPKLFRVPQPKTKAMLEGSYFHTAILEPEKLKDYQVIDVASRSTKTYKDACPEEEIFLLQKEKEHLDKLVNIMQDNLEMFDTIYEKGNEFELPIVSQVMGNMWKGKADIITKNFVIDIKTTSDISKFMYSCKTYNYDSQAYLYQRFFNKPLRFFVICKQTFQLGIYDCSPHFVEGGKNKVEKATEVYNKFFSNEKSHDINNYIHKEIL